MYLAMLCHELNGLHQTLGLVHVTPHAKTVHGNLLNDPLRVDDEQPAQSYAKILLQHAIARRNLLRLAQAGT